MNSAAITIISATLNRRDMLRRAIESVVSQGLDGIEHIVIDGASADGTLEMLKRYPHLTIISEQDENLYDAWNKGLVRANGLSCERTWDRCKIMAACRYRRVEPMLESPVCRSNYPFVELQSIASHGSNHGL